MLRGKRFVTWLGVIMLTMGLFVACGGGGGGGGSSSSVEYTGEEGAATLPDGATAAEFLTNGYGGIDALSVLASSLSGGGGPEPLALSAGVKPLVSGTVEIDDVIEGDVDGSFTVQFVWNTATDYFSGTVTYSGYSNMAGQSITGTAQAEGYGMNVDGPPDLIDLTFSNLTIVNWGMTWKVSGDMTIDNGWIAPIPNGLAVPLSMPDSMITIESVVLQAPGGDTFKVEGAQIDIYIYEVYYDLYLYGSEASGNNGATFFHPDYGYVYVETPMGALYVDKTTGLPDGVIQIWDEYGQFAWLEFAANDVIHWDVWWDGGNEIYDGGIVGTPDDTLVGSGTFASGIFTEVVPD